MSHLPFTMTDDIAYRLGKFDFPSFYNSVRWKVNKEPFELAAFFTWSIGHNGWPCKQVGDDWVTDWEGITADGYLDLKKIKTISQKLAYVRGRLSSYSVSIEPTRIHVCWANSYDFRDFFAECLNDIIYDHFVYLPADLGTGLRTYRSDLASIPRVQITKSETLGSIPGTPTVTLDADESVISYIVGTPK